MPCLAPSRRYRRYGCGRRRLARDILCRSEDQEAAGRGAAAARACREPRHPEDRRTPCAASASRCRLAAETQNVEENGRSKLERKGADLIVANDVSPKPGSWVATAIGVKPSPATGWKAGRISQGRGRGTAGTLDRDPDRRDRGMSLFSRSEFETFVHGLAAPAWSTNGRAASPRSGKRSLRS